MLEIIQLHLTAERINTMGHILGGFGAALCLMWAFAPDGFLVRFLKILGVVLSIALLREYWQFFVIDALELKLLDRLLDVGEIMLGTVCGSLVFYFCAKSYEEDL